jgi:hypothetical protein
MPEPTHDPDLRALELALGALSPSPGALDRDTVLYHAGQASARRSRAWPMATLALGAATAVLGAVLLFRPAPQPLIVERVVFVPVPQSGPEETPPSEGVAGMGLEARERPEAGYLHLRRQVLTFGVDALPQSPPLSAVSPPRPRGTDLDRLLESLDRPGWSGRPFDRFSGGSS